MGESAKSVRLLAMQAYELTISDSARVDHLTNLSNQVDMRVNFVYEYTSIDDKSIDSDDEIINWTFPDIADDFANAIWNLACGFYKVSASSTRMAYDLSAVALAFQIKQNREPGTSGYTASFSKWDRGDANTPNWSFLKSLTQDQGLFNAFDKQHACSLISEAHAHYTELCAFTHSRPFSAATGEPTNSMNLPVLTPGFDEESFQRFSSLINLTIGWTATIWLIAFPGILNRNDTSRSVSPATYKPLFSHTQGKQAFEFAMR